MLVGHVAVGLLAKKAEPRVSLGTYVGAALLADLVLFVFLIAGLERVEFAPSGRGAAEFIRLIDVGWSHSLAAGLAWGAVAALLALALRRSGHGAALIGLAVVSHWLLDAVTSDGLPLVPGGDTLLGLDLWGSLPLTLVIEGGLWLAALGIYSVSFPSRTKPGLHVFWIFAGLLTFAWYNNIAGPPPDAESAPVASLVFFSAVVAWAYWMDVRRPLSSA